MPIYRRTITQLPHLAGRAKVWMTGKIYSHWLLQSWPADSFLDTSALFRDTEQLIRQVWHTKTWRSAPSSGRKPSWASDSDQCISQHQGTEPSGNIRIKGLDLYIFKHVLVFCLLFCFYCYLLYFVFCFCCCLVCSLCVFGWKHSFSPDVHG